MTSVLAHTPESFLDVHDHVKREAGAIVGIALTEIGAVATRRITWQAIGRYFVCGMKAFSPLLILRWWPLQFNVAWTISHLEGKA